MNSKQWKIIAEIALPDHEAITPTEPVQTIYFNGGSIFFTNNGNYCEATGTLDELFKWAWEKATLEQRTTIMSFVLGSKDIA